MAKKEQFWLLMEEDEKIKKFSNERNLAEWMESEYEDASEVLKDFLTIVKVEVIGHYEPHVDKTVKIIKYK